MEARILALEIERAYLLKQNHNLKLIIFGGFIYWLYKRGQALEDGRGKIR